MAHSTPHLRGFRLSKQEIRQLRHVTDGVPIEQLARVARRGNVTRFEKVMSGYRATSMETIKRLADAFDLEVSVNITLSFVKRRPAEWFVSQKFRRQGK